MTQPTQYTPTTDFSQDEANNVSGRSTVNTAALDAEFANIETTIDSVCDNLALLQRDDGRLKDLSVEIHTISHEVLNLMGGFNLKGLWSESTDYAVNDICSSGAYTYCCTTAHTSGAEIDLMKWIQFGFTSGADAAQAAAAAQTSAIEAATSASSAATSATSAANSAASISGSVAQAAGYAATATTKAGEASSSATSAANSATAAAASAASIDTSNFATKNGANATGTWPISITGNAATATSSANGGVTSVAGRSGAVTLSKSDVGLGSVDNTADASKSVSYAANAGSANNLQGYVPGSFAAAGHSHSGVYHDYNEGRTAFASASSYVDGSTRYIRLNRINGGYIDVQSTGG